MNVNATTQLVYIPDCATRAWRRALQQDWSKTRLRSLLDAFGTGQQALEDDAFDLLVSSGLQDASGAMLDKWGAVVGEQRGPLGDADYRRFIQARMLVNRCNGTVDSLLRIWQTVTAPYVFTRYMPLPPAGFVLQTVRSTWMPEAIRRRVNRTMQDVKPGGVEMELVEALSGYFGFEGDDSALGYSRGAFARIV